MNQQTTIRIDNDLRSLLWGMVDDDKKTVNAVIWHLKKEYDKNKAHVTFMKQFNDNNKEDQI